MLLVGIDYSHLGQGVVLFISVFLPKKLHEKKLLKAFIYSDTGLNELTLL